MLELLCFGSYGFHHSPGLTSSLQRSLPPTVYCQPLAEWSGAAILITRRAVVSWVNFSCIIVGVLYILASQRSLGPKTINPVKTGIFFIVQDFQAILSSFKTLDGSGVTSQDLHFLHLIVDPDQLLSSSLSVKGL